MSDPRFRPARALRRAGPLLVCMLGSASGLAGQPTDERPIPFVEDFVHDGSVAEWRARPVDHILPAGDGLPEALTWLAQVEQGLVIAAEIRGGAEADRSARVKPERTLEIAVAGAESPRLPPIGWGHQFAFEVLADSTDCAELEPGPGDPAACRAWFAKQRELRERVPLLFSRAWRIPTGSTGPSPEVRASEAFAALDSISKRRLAPLAPDGAPVVRERPIAGTSGGIGVEVLVPWSAFPPVPATDLSALRVRVRWAKPPDAASDPFAAVAGRPLARALRHRITPCDYGLAGILVEGGDRRLPRRASPDAFAYMIPEASGDLRSLIVLDHYAAGYQYAPDPAARSPSAFVARYEVLDVGRGERLCTPILALASDGSRRTPPGWTATGEGSRWAETVDLNDLEVRRTSDGDLLVLAKPRVFYSHYGAGQCGGCPRVGADLYHVSSTNGEVTNLFDILEIPQPAVRDVEIRISEDWGEVTVYVGETDPFGDPPVTLWTARRHCRPSAADPSAAYVSCGVDEGVDEPAIRLRARYREGPPDPE